MYDCIFRPIVLYYNNSMRETIVTSGSVATAYVSAFFVGEECPAVRLGMVTNLTFDDKDNPEFDIAIGNYGGVLAACSACW